MGKRVINKINKLLTQHVDLTDCKMIDTILKCVKTLGENKWIDKIG